MSGGAWIALTCAWALAGVYGLTSRKRRSRFRASGRSLESDRAVGRVIAKALYVIGGLGVVALVFTHTPADRVVFWFLALPLACALLTGLITGLVLAPTIWRRTHTPTREEPSARSHD